MTENEKKLADNLAQKANELIDHNESETVLDYVKAIAILKQC